MITLKQAAEAFNNNMFQDKYSGSTFYGQFLPFNDSVSSGSSTRRRTVEVSPEVVIPTRRVAVTEDQEYIFSLPNTDFHNGKAIRRKHTVLVPDGVFERTSVADILNVVAGYQMYASTIRMRRKGIEQDMADFFVLYEMFFSSYESISMGDIILFDSRYFRCNMPSSVDGAGFHTTEIMELIDPVQTVDVTTNSAYNPVTEAHTSSVSSDVMVFVVPAELAYYNTRQDFEKVEAGDKIISTIVAVSAGDIIGSYDVIAVKSSGGLYTAHCRSRGYV